MNARGFTLLELMISSAIGAILLASAVWAGVHMQKHAYFEEETMKAQEAAANLRDYLQPLVENAGSGFGNAQVTIGSKDGAADRRYAFQVFTDAAFADDSTFTAASGQQEPSDAIHFIWGEPQTVVAVAPCPGYTTALVGGSLCTAVAPPSDMLGQPIIIFHPDLPMSCVYTVTDEPGGNALTVTAGHPTGTGTYDSPPAGDPCLDQNQTLFRKNNGTMAMVARAATLRVNWAGGSPVLEYDGDGDLGPLGYTVLSRTVERLKVSAGIADLTHTASQPLYWFPGSEDDDGGAAQPAIDLCDADPDCAVPGGTDSSDVGNKLDALMRRLRTVQFTVTTRTPRTNESWVKKDGANFAVDADGNLLDGHRRRTFTFQIGARNFQFEGLHPELDLGPVVN